MHRPRKDSSHLARLRPQGRTTVIAAKECGRPSALDLLTSPIYYARVVRFEDVNVKALTYPARHPEGRVECGRRDHDCVSRGGPWVFHSPQQLAVQGVDVQTDRGGPAPGLGVGLLLSAPGIDVHEIDLACHRPAIALEPAGVRRHDSLLITAHAREW